MQILIKAFSNISVFLTHQKPRIPQAHSRCRFQFQIWISAKVPAQTMPQQAGESLPLLKQNKAQAQPKAGVKWKAVQAGLRLTTQQEFNWISLKHLCPQWAVTRWWKSTSGLAVGTVRWGQVRPSGGGVWSKPNANSRSNEQKSHIRHMQSRRACYTKQSPILSELCGVNVAEVWEDDYTNSVKIL